MTSSSLTPSFAQKGNSSKPGKRKEKQSTKKEAFQAQTVQVQTLQNELETLHAQLASLKGKNAQSVQHVSPYHSDSRVQEAPRSFYGLPRDALVGECVKAPAPQPGLNAEFAPLTLPSTVLMLPHELLPPEELFKLMD
jgi:hypothetical protein